MFMLGLISAVFGAFILSVACTAFNYDEPLAGMLAGVTGSVFLLLGLKVLLKVLNG